MVSVVHSTTGSHFLERPSVHSENAFQSAFRKFQVTFVLTFVNVQNVIKLWSLMTESSETFHSVKLAAVRAVANVRSTIVPVAVKWPIYVGLLPMFSSCNPYLYIKSSSTNLHL